jgi:glucokinase
VTLAHDPAAPSTDVPAAALPVSSPPREGSADAAGPDAGPVLALDLGGTHLRTALALPDGTLRGRRRQRTPLADGADRIIDQAVESLRASLAEHREAGGQEPVAIGISAPGPLDVRTGVLVDPPNMGPSFRDLPLGPRLSAALALPAFLERDTHVAALAEGRFGAAVGLSDYVYLTVSTGIGGGVVTGGRLMTGPDGVSGELGHLVVDLDGPECGCGARGHLERLSSGSGIARSARDALAAGEEAPALRRIATRIAPAEVEAVHVAEAEIEGDPIAVALLRRARRAFAAAMVSIVDVFGPQAVIVGGGVAAGQGERLLGPAREAIARHAFRIQAARVRVVPAALGDDVALIGSVPLVGSALPRRPRGAQPRISS